MLKPRHKELLFRPRTSSHVSWRPELHDGQRLLDFPEVVNRFGSLLARDARRRRWRRRWRHGNWITVMLVDDFFRMAACIPGRDRPAVVAARGRRCAEWICWVPPEIWRDILPLLSGEDGQMPCDQCDQIWRFIGLWPTFKWFWQHLHNLPKSLTFLRNFGKGVKIYHFSSEMIFGQVL